MNIEIKGFHNLSNLKYEIEDNKVNYLFGLCGSGKSSISNALTKDEILDADKKINFDGETEIKINGVLKESDINYSLFNKEALNKYIISKNDSASIYNLFIDNDDGDFASANKKLDKYLRDIKDLIVQNDDYAKRLLAIQKNFGTSKITNAGVFSKSSILSKAKTAFLQASNKRIYKKIKKMGNIRYKWILEGNKLIDGEGKCPFCGKKLSNKFTKTLQDYKQFDAKFLTTFELDSQERRDIKLKRSPELESEIDKLTKNMLSLNKALLSWECLLRFMDDIKNVDFDLKKLGKIILNEEFYNWFSGFKSPINKLNDHIDNLKELAIESNNLAKKILSRKLNKINELLKSLSIPYKISTVKNGSKIESYVIQHIEEVNGQDRAESLSEGEKILLSLVLFLIENSKMDKDLILIDDPVSSFDDVRRGAINYTILNYLKGKTVLLLSHDSVFAKYAVNEKFDQNNEFIGKIDYIDNYNNQIIISPIVKEDVNSMEHFIREHIQENIPSYVKFLNARLCFETVDKSTTILRQSYSYLSDCFHAKRRIKFAKNRINKEDKILEAIKDKTGLDIGKFEDSMYENIMTNNLTTFDKALLLRCMIDANLVDNIPLEIKNELNDYVHLNSRYIICLNPYKFDFSTKSVREVIDSYIKNVINV